MKQSIRCPYHKHRHDVLEEADRDHPTWGSIRRRRPRPCSHVGIHPGDILTIDPTPDTHVGQLVIDQHKGGTITIGTLQRERRHDQSGEFYLSIGHRRIIVTEHNGLPIGKTLGVIEHHERSIA